MADDIFPQLSVILPLPDGTDSSAQTMDALRAQSVADELQIVLVAPRKTIVNQRWFESTEFADVKVVPIESMVSTAVARAAGIMAASAPLVVLAEDHSFPASDWAERFISAHQGPWAAVGPAMANANPRRALSWANLAIEYGCWLDPVTSQTMDHLPGHNSCYKRDLLLAYGENLPRMLEAESILHWDLRSNGHQLYLDATAKTFHQNYTRFRPSLYLRFLGGRLFAVARGRRWPILKRAVYGFSGPLIVLRRGYRILRDLQRIGRLNQFMPEMAFWLTIMLAADAFGEICGYLFGPGREIAVLSEMEFHRARFMKADDISPVTPDPANVGMAPG